MKHYRILSIIPSVALMLPIFASASIIGQYTGATTTANFQTIPCTIGSECPTNTMDIPVMTGDLLSVDLVAGFSGRNPFSAPAILDGVTLNFGGSGCPTQSEYFASTTPPVDFTGISAYPDTELKHFILPSPITFAGETNCTLEIMESDSNGNPASGGMFWSLFWDGVRPYFIGYDNTGTTTNHSTHIETVTPINNSTIATSSQALFGASGYITSADWSTGANLYITYIRDSDLQASVACTDCLYTHITIPILVSGDFNLTATSSALGGGHYTVQTSIRSPSFTDNLLNFFGFGNFAQNGILTATSTGFYAHAPNQYDILIASTTDSITAYLASSTVSVASCTSFLSFSLQDCLNLLFVPQTQPIMDSLANFKNNFLSYAPWGYVTRTVVILTNNATTTALPTFAVTPFVAGGDMQTLTYDMQDTLTGGASALASIHDPVTDKTSEEIIGPWIRLFVAISVLFIILKDIAGMATHSGRGGRKTHLA